MAQKKTPKIFIDGEAGTTGLEIKSRLEQLPVSILSIDPHYRKDEQKRKELYTQADLVVLCLPDDASRAAVLLREELIKEGNPFPKILDASTAFRTHPDWIYGFAELSSRQAEAISQSALVANPGCYATGAIALLAPLVYKNIIPADAHLSINAISGYSGGGHSMIEDHQHNNGPNFELYGLQLNHKHIPEIVKHAHLLRKPVFVPSVGHFFRGMIVSIPLHMDILTSHQSVEKLHTALSDYYLAQPQKQRSTVQVLPPVPRLDIDTKTVMDNLEIRIYGNEEQAVLTAKLDNLGKGAAGAAIQNIALMLGLEG